MRDERQDFLQTDSDEVLGMKEYKKDTINISKKKTHNTNVYIIIIVALNNMLQLSKSSVFKTENIVPS